MASVNSTDIMAEINDTKNMPSFNSTDSMAEWLPVQYGYLTISIVAILLNSAVIYLFLTRKYLRNMYSNIFLFSLAISDLCYAAVAIPLLIKCDQAMPQYVCYAYAYTMVFFSYSTVYHILLGISEKLCAICFTLKHHSMFCKSIAIKLSFSVWFLSIIFTHIPIWWEHVFPGDTRNATEKNEEQDNELDEAYYKFHFTIGFAIPVVISVIMYSMILHKIFKASNRRLTEDTQRNKLRLHVERKAALTFAIMLAAFLFSWSTWFLARIIYDRIVTGDAVYYFLTISRFCDPIFNPLLYTFLKNDFRRAFFSLFQSKKQSNNLSKMPLTRLNNHTSRQDTQEDTIRSSPLAVTKPMLSTQRRPSP